MYAPAFSTPVDEYTAERKGKRTNEEEFDASLKEVIVGNKRGAPVILYTYTCRCRLLSMQFVFDFRRGCPIHVT